MNIEPGALNHQGLSSSQQTNYADAVKRTLDERDYDIKAEETIVLFNIAEATSSHDDSNVQTLCDKLKIVPEKIKNIVRLGKRKPEASARPRPVEIQLASSYDRRITLSNCHLLKGTKVFAKPKLCWKDRLIEKDLHHKQFELIQLGIDRDLLRLRDLKLFHNGIQIDSAELDDLYLLSEKLKSSPNSVTTTVPNEWQSLRSRILLLNVRSINSMEIESTLLNYLTLNEIEIAILTETWLHSSKMSDNFNLFGQYELVSSVDWLKGQHGGVAVLRKTSSDLVTRQLNFLKKWLWNCFRGWQFVWSFCFHVRISTTVLKQIQTTAWATWTIYW